MRCFVGIRLPDLLAGDLARASVAIQATDERWRGEKWTPEGNLHITLAFLGEVAEDVIPVLSLRLGSILAASHPLPLPFSRLSARPGTRRSSMIWAEFRDPSGDCEALAATISNVPESLGLDLGATMRAFKPHVTLARARRPRPLQASALQAGSHAVSAGARTMSVLSATLFTSTLTRHGPIYNALRTWPLHDW